MRAADNPYRSERVEGLRFQRSPRTEQEVLELFVRNGRRGCICGPKGSGKTTLLENIRRTLHLQGWATFLVRASEEQRPEPQELLFSIIKARKSILLLDGAEQLGRLSRLALKACSRLLPGVLITSHAPILFPCLA